MFRHMLWNISLLMPSVNISNCRDSFTNKPGMVQQQKPWLWTMNEASDLNEVKPKTH